MHPVSCLPVSLPSLAVGSFWILPDPSGLSSFLLPHIHQSPRPTMFFSQANLTPPCALKDKTSSSTRQQSGVRGEHRSTEPGTSPGTRQGRVGSGGPALHRPSTLGPISRPLDLTRPHLPPARASPGACSRGRVL